MARIWFTPAERLEKLERWKGFVKTGMDETTAAKEVSCNIQSIRMWLSRPDMTGSTDPSTYVPLKKHRRRRNNRPTVIKTVDLSSIKSSPSVTPMSEESSDIITVLIVKGNSHSVKNTLRDLWN